jgi:Spy/CpxP family protein refolding chaperone
MTSYAIDHLFFKMELSRNAPQTPQRGAFGAAPRLIFFYAMEPFLYRRGLTVVYETKYNYLGGTMRKITGLLISAAAVLLIAQPSLYAERVGPMRGGEKTCMKEHGGPVFGDPARMQKDLGLTDEQVKKIADINKNHERKMLDYREKLAPKNIQLRRLLLDETVDMVKVRSLVKEIADLRAELQILRIQQRLDIEKVLTPEQKAKMKQHRMHMMKKRGFGPKGPGRDGHGPDR